MTLSSLRSNSLMPQQFPFVPAATIAGGTETTYIGNGTTGVNGQGYKVCRFTATDTLTVSQAGEVDILVVAGGGGGGGGTNGVHYGAGAASGDATFMTVTLAAGTYSCVIGAGGSGSGNTGFSGSESRFSTLIRTFGGGGTSSGRTGASNSWYSGAFVGSNLDAGGGAGSTASSTGVVGGAGLQSYITGSLVTYAQGGGGSFNAANGGANTGNGGCGTSINNFTTGGSGVVIIRARTS